MSDALSPEEEDPSQMQLLGVSPCPHHLVVSWPVQGPPFT